MSAYTDFWSLYTLGRPFGFRDAVYAGGWHRGQDIPGAVREMPWLGKNIPLLRDGNLFHRGYKPKLGYVWVYKVGDEFDTYCHTMSTGDRTFRLAAWGEPAGSSWGGPHLHLVRSRDWDAAWNTAKPVLDPRPIIQARLASVAGPDKPPVVIDPEEDVKLDSEDLAAIKKLIQETTPSSVWGHYVGKPDSRENTYGRAGDVLAITGERARKAATRSAGILSEIENMEPSQITQAQVDALTKELKAALPSAFIKALGEKLLSK